MLCIFVISCLGVNCFVFFLNPAESIICFFSHLRISIRYVLDLLTLSSMILLHEKTSLVLSSNLLILFSMSNLLLNLSVNLNISVAQSCPTLCDPMRCSTPGLPIHHQLPEFTQTHESVMPSYHLILCHPLHLLSSIFPSIRVFSSESVLRIRWPKYSSFSFSISPSNNSGPISFKMDWLDLFAVQGTLKSLLQHHSSKTSIILCSAFFMVQLSHPYMTAGKTIALTRWTLLVK